MIGGLFCLPCGVHMGYFSGDMGGAVSLYHNDLTPLKTACMGSGGLPKITIFLQEIYGNSKTCLKTSQKLHYLFIDVHSACAKGFSKVESRESRDGFRKS